jgi:hypothetical protein
MVNKFTIPRAKREFGIEKNQEMVECASRWALFLGVMAREFEKM